MIKLSWRHGLIPACITFGPGFMTRMGGTIDDGGLGIGIAMFGTALLVGGLMLMLELLMKQQAYLEKLNAERDANTPTP